MNWSTWRVKKGSPMRQDIPRACLAARSRFVPSGILAAFIVLALAVAAPRGSAAAGVKAGPAGSVAAAAARHPSVPPAQQTEMQGTVESSPQRDGVVTVPVGGGRTATLLAGFRGRWVPSAGWVVQVGPREQTQCGPSPPQVLRALCVSW